jgi:hypothetical protein
MVVYPRQVGLGRFQGSAEPRRVPRVLGGATRLREWKCGQR